MTKTKYWLSILAISVVLVAGSLAVSPIAIADDDDDDDSNDVVVMTCADNFAVFEIQVINAESSANAPAITIGAGTNCAQTLADLLDADFEIQNLSIEASGLLHYTIIRSDD